MPTKKPTPSPSAKAPKRPSSPAKAPKKPSSPAKAPKKPTTSPMPRKSPVGNDKYFEKKYGKNSWNNGYTN